MNYAGIDALRHMLDRGMTPLWEGRIIGVEEARAIIASLGMPVHSPPPAPSEAIDALAARKPPTEAMIQARIDACNRCEYYRAESDKCGICGCAAIVAQRSRSILGSCPKGHWDQ